MTLIRRFIVFSVIGILGFGSLSALQAEGFDEDGIAARIQEIPLDDRFVLEAFFRELLFHEGGAFVLFGSKPLALSGYYRIENSNLTGWGAFILLSHHNGQLKEGWMIWQKYKHLFPMNNFMLKSYGTPDDDSVTLYFLNKTLCAEMIQRYIEDFKTVLGDRISCEIIMDWFNDPSKDLIESLGNHQALYGTLLGFGRDNAWFFHRRLILWQDFLDLTATQEKVAAIRAEEAPRIGPYWEEAPYDHLSYIVPPAFVGSIYSQETEELQKRYLDERRKICKIYENGRFLEITLAALAR